MPLHCDVCVCGRHADRNNLNRWRTEPEDCQVKRTKKLACEILSARAVSFTTNFPTARCAFLAERCCFTGMLSRFNATRHFLQSKKNTTLFRVVFFSF